MAIMEKRMDDEESNKIVPPLFYFKGENTEIYDHTLFLG